MAARECRALLGLHQSPCRISILIVRRPDAHVAAALLHDDAEDDALLDAELCGINDGIVDATDVLAGVSRLEHGWLVDIEEGVEVFPGRHGGEGRGGPGVGLERHDR